MLCSYCSEAKLDVNEWGGVVHIFAFCPTNSISKEIRRAELRAEFAGICYASGTACLMQIWNKLLTKTEI